MGETPKNIVKNDTASQNERAAKTRNIKTTALYYSASKRGVETRKRFWRVFFEFLRTSRGEI